jgi:mannose-1-phosphate guanylyltransferase/mannose-1-phosphate guanylyltransferase/mannose-6-phosphate isomerase
MRITPVILCGGGGTRLWPMSTSQKPKQFQNLTSNQSMFELTLERVKDQQIFSAPMIVSGASHADILASQLANAGMSDATIILEPTARNTAPAIALAALGAARPDSVLLVMPSDHLIADTAAFHAATHRAIPLIQQGWLVTYGIEPTAPETGYGYIRMGQELENGVFAVSQFVEKPDRTTAEAMLEQGNHSWNGGIFLFRADRFLDALKTHAPEIFAVAQTAMQNAERKGDIVRPDKSSFEACPSDSIDYAVMEKADRVAVVPVSMGWSDIGSWDALYDIGDKDAAGNVAQGNVRLDDAHGNLLKADGVRISVHGVDNLIVIANGPEVLILPRGRSQKVRDFAKD